MNRTMSEIWRKNQKIAFGENRTMGDQPPDEYQRFVIEDVRQIDETLTLVNGATGSENGFGAILNGGLNFNFAGGRTAGVNGSLGLLEDDVTTWSIGGNISIPLN